MSGEPFNAGALIWWKKGEKSGKIGNLKIVEMLLKPSYSSWQFDIMELLHRYEVLIRLGELST